MNDRNTPLEQLLDLMVFAPFGLAVTIAEELPQMADKGRARLSQRTAAARLVGQLAVAEGRRRLGVTPPPAPPAPRTAPPDASTGPASPPVPPAPGGSTAPPPPRGSATPPPGGQGAPTSTSARRRAVAPAPAASAAPAVADPLRSSDQLAIPGYDSLSASQVVQRLASLSPSELEAVRAYESAHRGRRTILARVSQLEQG
jgi:hypothetical protein